MGRLLFVYGTLRDPDLLCAVLGRAVPRAARLGAVAPGFAAVSHDQGRRAALLRTPGGAAEGLALLGLSAFEIDLLDAYLGDQFRRSVIAIMIEEELHEAEAYLATVRRDAEPWSLSHWQRHHKPYALLAGAATAAELRHKLIALRPN